jgi:hypothetical protein
MPFGTEDAKMIATVVAGKVAADMAEEAAVALALDFLGGCGTASAIYAAYKASQQAAAITKLSKYLYKKMGKKKVRLTREMVEEAWDACP